MRDLEGSHGDRRSQHLKDDVHDAVPCDIQNTYLRVIRQDNPAFFVETLIFSRDKAVLMEGELTDRQDPSMSKVPSNRIGLWFKPWFFKHVEGKLDTSNPTDELIPIWDYLMRHDRDMCMTMGTMIPYGNAWWFRFLLGWMLPPQVSFLKSSHTKETREASIRKQVYQDVAFPAELLDQALDLCHSLFEVYPLMCYPCKVKERGGMLRFPTDNTASPSTSNRHQSKEAMFLNLGIYGIPKGQRESPDELFPMVTKVRQLEEWVRQSTGFQHTYCDSFQDEKEFEGMFDHTLYNRMRKVHGADGTFQRVFDKTRPEMDVNAWLQEEKALEDEMKTVA